MSDGNTPRGADRRAIPQRSTTWAGKLAGFMVTARLTPNRISILSVVFAAIGAGALLISAVVTTDATRTTLLILTAICIPLRLLCNMLDGMLAVEKGMHTPTGDLFNEVPDRIADLLLLIAAGYATAGSWQTGGINWGVALGWAAGAAAILTAYVRTLGAANGVGNFFTGPMAKPARMWVLFLACLLSVTEPLYDARGVMLTLALVVILLGSMITVIRRLARITTALNTGEVESR